MKNIPSSLDRQLFSRPLILGASISAGYGTKNGRPGAVLAKKLNPETKITNLAYNGAISVHHFSKLNLDRFNPSVIMAFDLFFWEVVRSLCDKNWEEKTKAFFQEVMIGGFRSSSAKFRCLNSPSG